ncbi:segregation and condensation protein A [Paeniglutamicibacter kerguelensis]|uniref:Segregation and condensation protein A n=1 Tax=Paeniglutamicibacter kerguelensis TaxID=254788 RepID=A0ABS4XA21_9MICC|nr:ScpA family protein [Paeniglutamicibacter kerguelensis]MBP2385310.1 segregation and condensation protein A [Paeniglutamicibacter kerguelensis]
MTATAVLPATVPTVNDDSAGGFRVQLENFSGPFDLLLSLIAKRELDITQIAMAEVTDEFIGYLKVLRDKPGSKALDETTEFLVVASTLLDLKAARLLPRNENDTDEDMALLEARDLLFARLLQYKAFKHAAGWISERLEDEAKSFPRQAGLEAHFAALLPELVFKTTPEMLARLALTALAPKEEAPPAEVGVAHLHGGAVSVREQAGILALMLQESHTLSFTQLTADADSHLVLVARFLALLEMYRERVVSFSQNAPLDTLQVTWSESAEDWNAVNLREEYEAAATESAADADPTTSQGESEA